MMDVVPLPLRKKPNFLKATKEQLDILMAGFAVSKISSKPHLTALSEATGLPIKWIASWFTRQRKKVSNAYGPVDLQDNATNEKVKSNKDPATVAAMSTQEIAAFKTEYNESAPLDSLALPVDSDPEQKPIPSQKSSKKKRKPTKKRKSRPAPYPHPPSSPLKPPFVSAPLPFRSAPSSSQYHSLEAQPQPTDCASPGSTFILREMVPVAYKPKTLNDDFISSSATAVDPALSEVSQVFSSNPTLATVSNVTAPLRPNSSLCHTVTSPSTDCSTKALYADTGAFHLGFMYPWQDSVLNENLERGSNKDSRTTIQKPQEALNLSNIHKSSTSASAQRKSMPCIDRPLRTLLPLNSPPQNRVPASHQYLDNYSQSLLGTLQMQGDRNTKENLLSNPQRAPHTSSKLRSSGPRALPPLFTTAARAQQPVQSTTNDAIPMSAATCTRTSPERSLIAEPTSLPLVTQDENEIRSNDQPGFLFDATTAPLKYLDVLVPFPDESVPMDEMVSRLLDPQLVEEDPFQAAMGLVFASQLGLNWDFT